MSSPKFPQCPSNLKALQHYMKLASDYDSRQPVISYWGRLYTLQSALKIDRKSPEARALLTALMDWLEEFKKSHKEDEAVLSDVAGQAVIENEAHKLFIAADALDRAANFNKNVVKMFYTAGILYDVCEVFGELPEEIAAQRKYAKWKATYIHNCLKSGEKPVPGPVGGEDEDTLTAHPDSGSESTGTIGFSDPGNQAQHPPHNAPSNVVFPPIVLPQDNLTDPGLNPVPSGYEMPSSYGQADIQQPAASGGSGVQLGASEYSKAQKYCKYAISSIDYEDSQTAISYLNKALKLLTTGVDDS